MFLLYSPLKKVSHQTNLERNSLNSSYIFLLNINFENLTVSHKISLEKNPSNFSYISLLDVNFEILTIGLYVLLIFLMPANFHENQRSKTISSMTYLNFKYLW